ncbi:MAG: ABC transporter substrate-binding protein [Rhodospirillales bacterium]|nr:ABC transporter substrate-binding protein [Rhodospirillales bacterium]MDE2198141.1 ABC transporter substrate-binding protein [Rhodospirillales bacterium]MDE2575932.1 ABC transporter substrate-binding protein [Rhodospirillales bacterium]
MIKHVAGALALSALALGSAQAADPTLTIGVMVTLSGPQAPLGDQVRDGFALAVAQAGGKLGGLPTKVEVMDDELKPDVAVTKIRSFVQSTHARFVVGPVFSVVMAAIARPVTSSGAFLISPNAGLSTFAGRDCNKNIFVTSYQNDQPHSVSGQFATDQGYKRVFLMAPNYQAGRDALNGFKSRFKGDVVAEDYVPLNQMDMQSEIAKIAAAKPDAVYVFLPGGLGINFVKQYRQAGLDRIPLLSTFTVDESVLPAEGDAAVGFYTGADWAPNMDNPTSKAFVAAFEAKYHYVPGSYAAQAYDTANLIASAVRAVGVSDEGKLRAALEKADFASVRGSFKFGMNHYPIQDFYLAQVAKRPDGKYQTEIRKKVFTAAVDSYAAECHMK